MLRPNSMYTEATAALMAVLNAENPTQEEVQGAFEQFCGSIAASVQADYESAHGDSEVLARRGFRQLTSEETRYYQGVIEAGKSKNPVQTYAGLLEDKTMPTTIIEDVYRDLQQEHPLLAEINFVSVQYLTRWILNDHTVQTAAWGEINSEITKRIISAFRVVEVAQCKLSAFTVIEKDMLDLGQQFLDNYIRTFLKEALATAIENSIATGSGHNMPIGMDRDVHKGVSIDSANGYPRKTAIKVKSFMPEEYGPILANLAETEVWYTNDSTGAITPKETAADKNGNAKAGYSKHGGASRTFDEALMIVNQKEYLCKVMPATTVLSGAGEYKNNLFPFPTKVCRVPGIANGEAILCLPKEYFFALGSSKEGTLEFSDEYRFLEDQRTFKIKMHGNGLPWDDTVAVLLDISELDPAYITVLNKTAE